LLVHNTSPSDIFGDCSSENGKKQTFGLARILQEDQEAEKGRPGVFQAVGHG